ncbi:lactate dehydrogenase [Oceaniferula spumae]|uniref:Lactate dehydrogenase n=1 Tax=Oceaniferula spumae TaxID=2979115 RepID=A0AAT9FJN9_9BACT
MKVAVFSTQPHDRQFLQAEENSHEWVFFENHLREATASLAEGCDAVCVFVNDDLSESCLKKLHELGIRLIALRCAGFNNVDLPAAKELGLTVLRVPEYSPYAVAEHTLALLLALNRHIHKAYTRVRDGNFSLNGLMGFDLRGKTVGVIGVGKIGSVFCDLLSGFGVKLLAYDPTQEAGTEVDGLRFTDLDTIFSESDVISLHCPLTPETHHVIDAESLAKCKDGLYLVNTSRGGLVDADAAIQSLKSGKLGGLALDVYEEEAGLFFEDCSDDIIGDDILMRLTTFPNVLLTSHQAFFTHEAVSEIARVTHDNLDVFEQGGDYSGTEVS